MRRPITLAFLLAAFSGEARPQSVAGVSFDGPVTIGDVPQAPVTVHAGDFNDDGKLDLVATNGTPAVHVLLQDPRDRGRWTPAPIEVGSSCYFARAADFDGDGIDDLAVADGASTAYYVRSRGDGAFDRPQGIAAAAGSRWIAAGDWNRDGRIDMASSNLTTGTLTIFVNDPGENGAVMFRQTQPPASGRNHTLEAIDFDGDGLLDLALGTGPPGIQLHRGQGDGTFVYKPPNVTTLGCVQYLATGDFNNDGKHDLAPTCIEEGQAYAGVSEGNGSYRRTLVAPFAPGTEASAVGDLDGDGNDDLALTSEGSGALRVYRGDGGGGFDPPVELGPTGAAPLFAIAVDLDRDGRSDVVTADTGGSTLTVFHGREGERFLHSSDSITGYPAARCFDIEDFDRDGIPDAFLTATSLEEAFIYLRPGGTSPTEPSLTAGVPDRHSSLVVADLNADGIPDLAGASVGSDTALVTLLDAGARPFGQLALPCGDSPQEVAVGLIDSDSTLDLAVAVQNDSRITLYPGAGDGTFGELLAVPTIERPRGVLLGDFTGDGLTDLLVTHARVIALHRQVAGGGFGAPEGVLSDGTRNITKAAAGDVDADGKLDLVLAEARSLGALILRGAGDGAFGEPLVIPLGSVPQSLVLTDFDGDGRLDITAASPASQVLAIALNRGPESFADATRIRIGSGVALHRILDMNADGVPDLVAFGPTATTVRLGRMEGPAGDALLRRGDADGNGKVEITDPVAILNSLFRDAAAIGCEDAADADDDGRLDITDAINILTWLFRDGPEPGAPGPFTCGPDPGADDLAPCMPRC